MKKRIAKLILGRFSRRYDYDLNYIYELEISELSETIVSRWGKAAQTDMAVAFGMFYPTFKRGLGHAQACEPVIKKLVEPEVGEKT